jgi:predicted peroxiredoxin
MNFRTVGFAICMATGILWVGVNGVGAAETRDGVLIHVTHGRDDPHRVVMALTMASMMSADHPVLVYFDIKGVEVVLKNAEGVSYAQFPSSVEQLPALIKQGVTLMVCPGCMKAAGKTPEDLAPGIQVADKAAFFSFTAGRIIVLDY